MVFTHLLVARMVELVDTQDLSDLTLRVKTVSALGETLGVEPLKFGEAFRLVIPSQANPYDWKV